MKPTLSNLTKRGTRGGTTAVVLTFIAATAITGSALTLGLKNSSSSPVAYCNSCEYTNAPSENPELLSVPQAANTQVSSGNLPRGGTWKSKLGTITSTGQYTAPDFFAAGLTDTIEYWAQGGLVYTTDILIKRDSTKPIRGANPITAQVQADGQTYLTPSVPNDGKWHEVIYPDHVDDADVELSCIPITPVTVSTATDGTQTVVKLNTQVGDAQSQSLYAQATPLQVVGAQKCKRIGPIYPGKKPTGSCTPGQISKIYGPVKQYQKGGAWMNNGEFTVTAAGAADIRKIFKITVTVGLKVNIQSQPIDYTQIQNVDKYVCGATGWEYAGSSTCVRTGTGVRTIPGWGMILLGYPGNGGPLIWTPWSCAAI